VKALKNLVVAGIVLVSLATVSLATAQTTQSELQKKIEQYLRHIYAFGPEVKLVVAEPKDSEVLGLLVTTVELTSGESHDTAKMYLSKDGKFLFRGDMTDMSKDPMAETRAKIDLKSAPSVGNPGATVNLPSITIPFSLQEIGSDCGSAISSAVTITGPNGQKVSSDFERTHWLSPR